MTFTENTANVTESISALRHDLRTPINAIIGYSEMLMEDLVDKKQTDFYQELQEVNASGYDLLSIINKYLQTSDKKELKSLEEFSVFFDQMKVQAIIPIEKLILDSQKLKQVETEPEVASDIERIDVAIHRLQELINAGMGYSKAKVIEEIRSINLADIIKNTDIKTSDFHVLVVDDNDNNRDLFQRQLEKEGYQVSVANDGIQGLDMIKAGNYDLILLDLLMPGLNGYQVLEQLKSDENLRDIPVIMISASDEIDTVVQCLKIGAEDYLPKPSNPILLKARIGTAIEKRDLRAKEKKYVAQINSEIDKGRTMQLNFLPQDEVDISGWNIQGYFKPAYQMAGDFYDSFQIDEDYVAIVIADVCDKGVGAALFMALFRSLMRLFAKEIYDQKLASNPTNYYTEILNAMKLTNEYVAEYHGSLTMFATMFFAVLNVKTGKVNYINGGHEPVFIINSKGEITQNLKRTGPAVGIMPGANFKIQETFLDYGDTLLGYTDGVTDAKTPTGGFFHTEGIISIVNESFPSASYLVEKIANKLTEHIGQAQQFDDITMIAVQRINK
jgi:phosphoserine phosphatase RsbU/P